jgi:hypothetical protein
MWRPKWLSRRISLIRWKRLDVSSTRENFSVELSFRKDSSPMVTSRSFARDRIEHEHIKFRQSSGAFQTPVTTASSANGCRRTRSASSAPSPYLNLCTMHPWAFKLSPQSVPRRARGGVGKSTRRKVLHSQEYPGEKLTPG